MRSAVSHTFLRPRDIITSRAGLNGIEKQQHLLAAITDYYQQHYADACKLRGDQPLPIIATGHLTTVGASKSDAVRDIYIGTLDAFRHKTFHQPTTSRSGIFTARRLLAAWNMFAIAVPPYH